MMTMDTTSDSPAPHNHLPLESIPVIDLRLLSQSELTSLSHCSTQHFDLTRCDDVVIPKIDRSVFNESAGSRKQTYSRLRLAPRKPESVARGRRSSSVLIPNSISPPIPTKIDPETKDNKRIISVLRGLLGYKEEVEEENHQQHHQDNLAMTIYETPQPTQPINVESNGVIHHGVSLKKRGRKRKSEQNPETVQSNSGYELVRAVEEPVRVVEDPVRALEIVNKNGVAVDIEVLGNMVDPFGPELRRRTIGLSTEEELLGFLRGLEGQWGSRRKKRKIIDANEFGDFLPIDWKLLLSLKRREGRFSLNCRRYVSPHGQQFVSCKEVSLYLFSVFGSQNDSLPNSPHDAVSDPEGYEFESGSTAGPTYKDVCPGDELIHCPASPSASLSSEHDKQVIILETENLAEVEIRDLLECHICKKSFDEKDAYLQHLLSSHQRNSKKCRTSTSICDGVIIKDGQYECQFCHKIFHERRRYNSHVGVHVRNYVRSQELSSKKVEALSAAGVPLQISQVDASVNVDKGSVPSSTAITSDEVTADSPLGKLDVVSCLETSTVNSKDKLNSIHNQQDTSASAKPNFTVEPDKLNSTHNQQDTRASVKPNFTVEPDKLNSTHNQQDTGASVKPNFTVESDNSNIDSPPENLGVSSIPEESTSQLDSVLVDGSMDSDHVTGANRLVVIHPHSHQDAGASAPYNFTGESNNENVDSRPDKIELSSIQEESTAKFTSVLVGQSMDSEQVSGANSLVENTPCSQPDTGASVPHRFTGESGNENVYSPPGNIGLSSIPEESTANFISVLDGGSLDGEQVVVSNGLDENPPCSQPDFGASVPQSLTEESGRENVDSCSGNIELSSIPNESTAKATLVVGSVDSEQETYANRLDEILDDSYHEKPDNGYGSCCKEVTEADFITNTLNDGVGLSSISGESSAKFACDLNVGSAGIIQETGAEIFDEIPNDRSDAKQNSTYDLSAGKMEDDINSNLDGCLSPCFDSATLLSNNENHCTLGGKDVIDSTIETDRPFLEQEVGSLSFSPSPSVSDRIGDVETRTNEYSFDTFKDSKVAEAVAFASNELESGFESKRTDSCKHALFETVGNVIGNNVLPTEMVQASPPFVQSSNYFPTLNLMPEKDIRGSILQTFTLESNSGNVDSRLGVLRLNSLPEESTAKSTYPLDIGSVGNKPDTAASNFEVFNGRSRRNQNNLDADLSSCLNSAPFLCSNEKYDSFGGRGPSNNNFETGKPYLDLEASSFRFSPAPSFSAKVGDMKTRTNEFSFFGLKESNFEEVVESGSHKPESSFGSRFGSRKSLSGKDALTDTIRNAEEENILQRMMVETSPSFLQSSNCFSNTNMTTAKGVSDLEPLNQKLEHVPGFDDLRLSLGDMDSSKFQFVTGMESNSLPAEPMDFAYSAVLEQGLDTPAQFEWESMLPSMHNSQQVTTVCVWCGVAFNREMTNPGMQSDSVCPTCKANNSLAFNGDHVTGMSNVGHSNWWHT